MKEAEFSLIGDYRPRRVWPLLFIALAVGAYFGLMLTLSRIPWYSDIKTYYYPAWDYLSQSFRVGAPPLWCTHLFCGFPLFADSETGWFYPVNLLLLRLPTTAGFNYSIIVHYLLGGWFTYLYCRRLRLGRSASVFASIPFVLGGFFIARLVYPNVVATAAWMPLFFYFLERALDEERYSFYVACGAVLGLQFLAGFLMVPLMQMSLAFFYALLHPARGGKSRSGYVLRSLAGLALALGIGAGLGMVQNLPSYHLVQNSYRAGGLAEETANINHLPPLHLLGLLFPHLFGLPTHYTGAFLFEETTMYMGILPLLFIPAAFFKPRRWHAGFFGFAALVALILCLGNQGLLWRALHLLPGFSVLKGPARFLLIFNFSAAVLAGIGFDRWREASLSPRQQRRLPRFWVRAAVAAAMLLYTAVILYHFNVLGFQDFLIAAIAPLSDGFSRPAREILNGLSHYFTTPSLTLFLPLLFLLLFLLLFSGKKRGRPGGLKVAAALLAVVADLFVLFPSITFVPARKVESEPPAVRVLRSDNAGGRVALLKEPGTVRLEYPLCSNQLLPYGLDDPFGFSTIQPLRVSRFLGMTERRTCPYYYELMGVTLLYSHLVPIDGMLLDLGMPFSLPAGLRTRSYEYPAVKAAELRVILDGTLMEKAASGNLYLSIGAVRGGETRVLSVLHLVKEGGRYCRMEVVAGDAGILLKPVSFDPVGKQETRDALEVVVPVDIAGDTEELVVSCACDRGLGGARITALGAVNEAGQGFPILGLPLSGVQGRTAIYETPTPRPRAWFAWKPVWAADWKRAVDSSWRAVREEGSVPLVESEIAGVSREALDELEPPGPEARIYDYEEGDDRIALRTSNPSDSLLVLSLDYLPGWKARIDGEETPLFSAFGCFTAIHLPGGDHEVELNYTQPGLGTGGLLTSVSIVLAALVFVFLRRRERGEKGGETAAGGYVPPPSSEGISAFFPCYNDAPTLREVVEKALAVLPDLSREYEVIIVDDGSEDGSVALARELERSCDRVRLVRHEHNRGYGAALRSGIAASTLPWIFYTDSDGQYDVDELRRLHALSGAADVINGYKRRRNDSWYRRAMGSVYKLCVRHIFAIPIRDVDCDFRLLRGETARNLDLRCEGGAVCVELVGELRKAGASFAEIPVSHHPRRAGRSQFFRLKNLLVMIGEIASLWWRWSIKGGVG